MLAGGAYHLADDPTKTSGAPSPLKSVPHFNLAPLENAIKQVPGLVDLRSTTSRGSCEISAFMDWNTNVDLSLQRIEAG